MAEEENGRLINLLKIPFQAYRDHNDMKEAKE
jgi:hypothetical protein